MSIDFEDMLALTVEMLESDAALVLAEYDSGRVDGRAVVAWLARDSVASEVNDPSAGSEPAS